MLILGLKLGYDAAADDDDTCDAFLQSQRRTVGMYGCFEDG